MYYLSCDFKFKINFGQVLSNFIIKVQLRRLNHYYKQINLF